MAAGVLACACSYPFRVRLPSNLAAGAQHATLDLQIWHIQHANRFVRLQRVQDSSVSNINFAVYSNEAACLRQARCRSREQKQSSRSPSTWARWIGRWMTTRLACWMRGWMLYKRDKASQLTL